MTGVPAPKPKAYPAWREIAAELARGTDLEKALELAHELNCALKEQSILPQEEDSPTGGRTNGPTTVQQVGA